MALTDRANLILDAFDDQIVTASEVLTWAESELLAIKNPAEIPTWLLDLLRDGPAHFLNASHPWRMRHDFQVRFAIHACRVDLKDRDSILRFANWLSRAVLGEDIDAPFVALAYEVDHYLDDHRDEALAVQCIQEDLPDLLPRCHAILDAVRAKAGS